VKNRIPVVGDKNRLAGANNKGEDIFLAGYSRSKSAFCRWGWLRSCRVSFESFLENGLGEAAGVPQVGTHHYSMELWHGEFPAGIGFGGHSLREAEIASQR